MSDAEKYRAYANDLLRNPDDPESIVNQFSVLSEKKEYAKHYLPLAKRAYDLAPGEINTMFNYASALHRNGYFEKALRLYKACVDKADAEWMPVVLHHIGIAYRTLNDNTRAADYYQRAYDLKPDPSILKDKALALLAGGDLYEGLKLFEARKESAKARFAQNGSRLVNQQKLPDSAVHWDGEDLTGKHLVVYHEEGSGDFIQVCRFIPRLRKLKPASIKLCGPVPNLLDLVADNIEVDGIVPLSEFDADYVVGSWSVPWRTGVTYADVSGKPYFAAEPLKLPKRGKLNVGLVWRGNPAYGMDLHRSMPFASYAPLFDLPGVAFHSLQAGPPALEVTELGYDGFVANLEPFCSDWRATARVIQSLDVVVSVDTACAHLAGALGKPVYILTTCASDWRWNRATERTVWYDSARVIRQATQDHWSPSVLRVRYALKGMLDERRQAA